MGHRLPSKVSRHVCYCAVGRETASALVDRKSTRLNSSHQIISYAVFCLKKKKTTKSRDEDMDEIYRQNELVEFIPGPYAKLSDAKMIAWRNSCTRVLGMLCKSF